MSVTIFGVSVGSFLLVAGLSAYMKRKRVRALESAKKGAPENDNLVGTNYRGYEVFEFLGSGGQGKVYRVTKRQGFSSQSYALKFSPRPVAVIQNELQNPNLPERYREQLELDLEMAFSDDKRFEREMATLIDKIDHPNVIKIVDYGLDESERWIVMPYLGETSLAHRLEQGELSSAEVCRIFQDVSNGLQAVHDRGVVHRDLKLQNIMLDEGGRAVIIDFGLAKGEDDKTFTTPGTILGTTEYIAPEQINFNEPQNEKTDQFALGALIYFCLCGAYPYPTKGLQSLMLRDQCEYDSLLKYAPEAKPEVNDVLQKMMAKLQKERYASVAEAFQAFRKAYGFADVTT